MFKYIYIYIYIWKTQINNRSLKYWNDTDKQDKHIWILNRWTAITPVFCGTVSVLLTIRVAVSKEAVTACRTVSWPRAPKWQPNVSSYVKLLHVLNKPNFLFISPVRSIHFHCWVSKPVCTMCIWTAWMIRRSVARPAPAGDNTYTHPNPDRGVQTTRAVSEF